jgi:hypothetical protein
MSETAALLFRRSDWLRFVAIPGRHGNFDVALVFDGGYGREDDAARNAADFARQLSEAMAADGRPLGSAIPQAAAS